MARLSEGAKEKRVKLILWVNESTAQAFKRQVAKKYGNVRGAQSIAGEAAILDWIEKTLAEEEATEDK